MKKHLQIRISKSLTYFVFIAIGLLVFSCIPQKRIALMQYEELIDSTYALTFDGTDKEDSIYTIQPNDYLYIDISSVEKEITEFFQPLTAINYITGTNQALTGYRVNDDGTIDFPYVGTIYLQGQTLRQARETIRKETSGVLGSARIEIKIINNTITLLGEVEKQGQYNVTKSKVNIYEAIGLAHGFTDYAKRNEVKVLRSENGVRKLYLVDMNDGRLIGKNMFYVFPNDIIYVEPMRAKAIGLTPTFSLSVLTTLITFFVLLQTVVK